MPSFDPLAVKLGKKIPVHNDRALRFGDYLLDDALPTIPSNWHWGANVPRWLIYENQNLGCCTISAAAHMEDVWNFNESGTESLLTNNQIISAYSGACGYVPGDPSTDQGGIETVVLDYWKNTGIGMNKILTYTTMEPGNDAMIKAATYLFGGVYIGIQLPITAQTQSVPNGTWSLTPGYKSDPNAQPGSWGGHSVNICGYNSQKVCVITWGMVVYATWQWLSVYMDEAYCPLSPQWIENKGISPNHFSLAQLQSDLRSV